MIELTWLTLFLLFCKKDNSILLAIIEQHFTWLKSSVRGSDSEMPLLKHLQRWLQQGAGMKGSGPSHILQDAPCLRFWHKTKGVWCYHFIAFCLMGIWNDSCLRFMIFPEGVPQLLWEKDGVWFSNLWYLIFQRKWDLVQSMLGEPQLNFRTNSTPTFTQLLDA